MSLKRCAVIGASGGVGRQIVRILAEKGISVRAISRNPPLASALVEPFVADVTDAHAVDKALDEDFDAIFYVVDIHGLRNTRKEVRAVMYDGCVYAICSAVKMSRKPRFILVSVIGADESSWLWWLLNVGKRGMLRNILDREQVLKNSSLPYVICRAPRLNNDEAGAVISATSPQHFLNMQMSISRTDLARVMVRAAEDAPARTTWDVFADADESIPVWLRPFPLKKT
jgi:uncharacterized protein YbjT (DUF2867 family)